MGSGRLSARQSFSITDGRCDTIVIVSEFPAASRLVWYSGSTPCLISDLREYSFGQWLGIFFKVVPALFLAQLLWSIVIAGPLALVWWALQIPAL